MVRRGVFFFFQAEDGIRDLYVTGVQTCALPICRRGDKTSSPSYINTFQRGPQESVWETVPQPSWEPFNTGQGGPNGFLPLFIQDSQYARQWRYTDAPDADARAVQAAFWANTWATQQNKQADVAATVAKAA